MQRLENNLPCPLTVREGRNWITQVMAAASDTVSVCEESIFVKINKKLQKKLNTVRDKLTAWFQKLYATGY